MAVRCRFQGWAAGVSQANFQRYIGFLSRKVNKHVIYSNVHKGRFIEVTKIGASLETMLPAYCRLPTELSKTVTQCRPISHLWKLEQKHCFDSTGTWASRTVICL